MQRDDVCFQVEDGNEKMKKNYSYHMTPLFDSSFTLFFLPLML